MIEEIKYRQATAEDYKSILDLYNDAYQMKRSEADLQWLYDDNPMGRGTLFIATIEDTVIGMQGIVKYQFWKDLELVDNYKSEDSLIHENHRGQGVYKKLYQMVFNFIGDVPIWGLTDKKTILERTGLPSEKRFNLAAAISGFVSPSLFKGEQKVWSKTILYNSLYLLSIINRKTITSQNGYQTESISNFIDIEEFGRNLSKQFPDVQVPILSQNIIQWRLRDNPKVKNWKVFAMRNSDNGIKALSLVTYNGKRCRWLSSYFHKGVSISDKAQHIQEVQKCLFEQGCVVIDQWLFDTNIVSEDIKKLMLSNGFNHVKKGLWIIKNQPKENATVHEILFSAQLGLD
ncbi:MAG: hypothetical protein ACI86M_001197 [Saprospiraceae bacterium]